MQDTEEIGQRLQRHLPFLRQMLNSLNRECPQYIKINAICDIIDKRKNIKYVTLEKCEKVIELLQKKTKRTSPPPIVIPDDKSADKKGIKCLDTQAQIFESVKSHFETINSPESPVSPCDEIESPDEEGDDVATERYENDRPSIYSVVADTINPSPPPIPPPLLNIPPPPMVPAIDTSKPPISAEDLKELLLDVDFTEEETELKDKVVDACKDLIKQTPKSKVSLVPTPFHKKIRKADTNGDKISANKPEVNKTNKDNKDKSDKNSVKSKSDIKSDKSDKNSSKDSKNKDNVKKDKSKSSRSKLVEKVVESSSIFGSLLSSIDEQMIADKDKEKTKVRRDSKDGDHAKCDSASSSLKHSKDKDSKDGKDNKNKHSSKSLLDRLASKIKNAEKDMASALKKEGLSEAEQEAIKKKYNERIARYKKERSAAKRHSSSSSSKSDKSKERRKSDDKERDKSKKCEKDKSKEKSSKTEKSGTGTESLPEGDKTVKKDSDVSSRPEEPKTVKKDSEVPLVPEEPKIEKKNSDVLSPPVEKVTDLPSLPKGKTEKSGTGTESLPEGDKTVKKDSDVLSPQGDPRTVKKDSVIASLPEGFKIKKKVPPTITTTAATVVPTPPAISSFIRKKVDKVEDKISTATVTTPSNNTKPLEPPPLPLGFQDFNPFANETAEINRLNASRKKDANILRSPLHEVGNEHGPLPQTRDVRESRDSRSWSQPPIASSSMMRGDPYGESSNRFAHPGPQPPGPNYYHPSRDRQVAYDSYEPRHSGHMQWIPPEPRRSRWTPPPPNPHWVPSHRGPGPGPGPRHCSQPPNAGFHPFDPIGNEYDLSMMSPVDFYSPARKQSSVPQNYRQWRQLKERDEQMKKKIEEANHSTIQDKDNSHNGKKNEEVVNAKVEEKPAEVESKKEPEVKKDKEEQESSTGVKDDKPEDPILTDNKVVDKPEDPKSADDNKVTDATKDEKKKVPEEVVQPVKPVEEDPVKNESTEGPSVTVVDEPDLNLNDVDRSSLLRILSQAKKTKAADGGTYLPVRILDLMERFLQKHEDSTGKEVVTESASSNTATSTEEGVEIKKDVTETKSENTTDDVPDDVKEKSNSEILEATKTIVVSEEMDSTTIPDETSENKPDLKNDKDDLDTENKEDEVTDTDIENLKRLLIDRNQEVTEEESTIVRRLRRRTKSINYNDSEDSPKRKRRTAAEMKEANEAKNAEIKTENKTDVVKKVKEKEQKQKPVNKKKKGSKEVPAVKDEAETSKPSVDDSEDKLDNNAEDADVDVDKIDVELSNLDITINNIVDGVVNVEHKLLEVMEKLYMAEHQSMDSDSEDDNEFLIKVAKRKSVPAGIFEFQDESSTEDSEKLDKEKKRPRKSELDILHQDIKENLGDGIMSSRRGNSLRRTSSPESVQSNTSFSSNLDLKDVKIPPAVDELFKKGKTLRVVLKKLPDTHDICVSPSTYMPPLTPPPSRPRLSRGCKTPLPIFDDDSFEKDLDSPTAEPVSVNNTQKRLRPASTESVSESKKPKPNSVPEKAVPAEPVLEIKKIKQDFIPDKNYYLKLEKQETNACHLCDFIGTPIIAHYLHEHPDSEVLISRLSPDATQDAFQDSVLNDYTNMDLSAITGKKNAKYDFRCRFCSNDLQKELTSTFYDHVSSHTGEPRYHCPFCDFKHHVRAIVKTHISFEHAKNQEPRIDEVPKNIDKLFGYFCSECNFLQLRKKAVSEHIEMYHAEDKAYVYTINMSLPILQRTLRMRKDVVPDEGFQAERKLRSSQRLKKTEVVEKSPEVSEKKVELSPKITEVELQPEKSKSIIPKVPKKTEDVVMSDVSSKSEAPPSSAFVCDDWDELLTRSDESEKTKNKVTTTPKRSSNIVDKLKNRLEKQGKSPSAYQSPPIDVEYRCTSEIMDDTENDAETPGDLIETLKKEKESPKKDFPITEETFKDPRLSEGASKSLKEVPRLLVSVGVIDALVDDDDLITYVCRKASCIFRTTDSRVHEVHCNYTHGNCMELIDCSMCSMSDINLSLCELFAHLCDHVEGYLESRVIAKRANIKVEINHDHDDLEQNVDVIEVEDADDSQPFEPVIEEEQEESNPLEKFFAITRVESLATKLSEPPPLAPLSKTLKVSEVDSTPKPTTPTKSPRVSPDCEKEENDTDNNKNLEEEKEKDKVVDIEKSQDKDESTQQMVTCKIVPMNEAELKLDRKSPAVIEKWLNHKMEYLFKCPAYDCDAAFQREGFFEQHLDAHDFKDTLIPCLYCNFKMRKENITVHVMMRHAHCHFGCGYCLYRARQEGYVTVHNELCHPEKILQVKKFDMTGLLNRYRPPILPPIEKIIQPYLCGCGLKYYVTKNYEAHRQKCKKLENADKVEDRFLYNCRYCVMGATTFLDVYRHIAIEHPFHDDAILYRQLPSALVLNVEYPAITNCLMILNKAKKVVFPKALTSTTEATSTVPQPKSQLVPIKLLSHGNAGTAVSSTVKPITQIVASKPAAVGLLEKPVPRIMLVHPSVLDNMKQTSKGLTPTASLTTTTPSLINTTPFPTTTTTPLATTLPSLITTIGPLTVTTAALTTSLATTNTKPTLLNATPKVSISTTFTSSTSEYQFTDDIIVNPTDLYKCSKCLEVMPTQLKFVLHVSATDSPCGRRPFVCMHCDKEYKLSGSFIQHVREHGNKSKNLLCALCTHTEFKFIALKKHMREVHKLNNIVLIPQNPEKTDPNLDYFIGKPIRTSPKEVTLDTLKKIASVVEDDDNTLFGPDDLDSLPTQPIFKFMATCKLCEFGTKVRSNFLRHMQLHCSGKLDSNHRVGEAVNPVPCLEKNELMFDKMTNLAASSFEGRMNAKSASASTSTTDNKSKSTELELEMKVPQFIPDHQRYVCGATGCNYLCLEEQNLRHHLQALHDIEQTYTCIHCKQELNSTRDGKPTFIDIDAIVSHLRLHEPTLYKCQHCEYLNCKTSQIVSHCIEKHVDMPVKYLTIRHGADVETPSKDEKTPKKHPWKCGICASRKPTEGEIKSHVFFKHALAAQFKCTYCAFKADNKAVFAPHYAEHHPMFKTSPDIIVAYYFDDKEETEEKQPDVASFDTTPLWVKNRDSVKHIRGILLDQGAWHAKRTMKAQLKAAVKSVTPVKRRMSTKGSEQPAKIQKTSVPKEEICVVLNGKTEPPIQNAESLDPSEITAIIEIADDDDDDDDDKTPEPNEQKDSADPPMKDLRKIPIDKLIATDYISTYGPLGKPDKSKFACPLCTALYPYNKHAFKHHLYEELQYNRFQCMLCNQQTTTYGKMIEHYAAKHLKLCEIDSIAKLSKNNTIETWVAKVVLVQSRIILHNRAMRVNQKKIPPPNKTPQPKSIETNKMYACMHCKHETYTTTEAVAHCRAAHSGLAVRVYQRK